MEAYYVCNGNLVKQDTVIDPKDIFIIQEPFEPYTSNDNKEESLHQLETSVLQESRKRNCREWSQYETKILMDMYRRNVTQVGPTKKFKSKKEMFQCIALTLSSRLNINRTAHQCENRYKTVFNQRKVGRTILRKTKTNTGNILNEKERSQSDVTASVSADHDYNGQNSETDGQCDSKYINEWGEDDTKLLMELYRKNIPKVGLERTFRTKLKMFEHIANSISSTLNISRTAEQCLNRYKTIFRRKYSRQNRLNNNDLSANNIFIDDSTNSNDNTNCDTYVVNNLCDTEFNTCIKQNLMPKSKESDINQETLLTRTLREIAIQKEKTLLKIAANQERAEERRHQETMDLIRQLGETIVKCIENRPNEITEQHY